MAFTLPAPTTTGQVSLTDPTWANFLAIAAFLNGLNLSAIASIHSYTIALGATVLTNTATITSVNTAKAVIIPQGTQCTPGTITPDALNASLVLTNATTVTATRFAAPAGMAITIFFTVVEYA